MEHPYHRFSELFAQLGLAADPQEIRRFLAAHAPLDPAVRLEDAPFWSPAQAALLREKLLEDADWAEVVDQLSAALRVPRIKVVCLCASWCGVCRDFVAHYAQTRDAVPGVTFDWRDVEDDVESLGDIDVANFPCVLIGVAGEPVFYGPITPQRATLERLLQNATDMPPLPPGQPDRQTLKELLAG